MPPSPIILESSPLAQQVECTALPQVYHIFSISKYFSSLVPKHVLAPTESEYHLCTFHMQAELEALIMLIINFSRIAPLIHKES